ncbi:hypothetical protein [Clostridium rectalis]|uniref:hypothetical protein n=1 Tax=Clostridium rectalis TaxID=2040295 RepID=UPI000F63F1AC|nr:hypothetical protein [Clostridium rectalis]
MKKSKNKIFLILLIIILSLISFIKYRVVTYKCKEVTYAVERYLTAGLFNSHKLHSINNFHLSFSDGNIAVVKVMGVEKKSPHKKITYNIFLEKNSKGIWKVKKLYQVP